MDWGDIAGFAVLRAVVLIGVGLIAARLMRRLVNVVPADSLTPNARVLVGRALYYGVFALFAVMAVSQLGFDLSVLLGAAGILTVALGFASQTSASNVISGLFLIGERAISVGDVVKIGEITGEVLSVDLLSVKLRTFDNLYVRIPNEDFMKARVTTMNWFPIRRYDLQIGIAYHVDIRKARDVLLKVARDFHLCLDEPAPLIILQGFGDSSINIQFSVWAAKERYLDMRNGIHERVKEAFDREGIEIPFPHRTLYAGSETSPLPVTVIGKQS
ncbi:MAG: mechanosensitive ion channel family protein [Gammaproteobacteria bacterium]|nr:mechanosensitive ion channel family protein [Gammaproteobacteria bacterium]